MTRVFGAEDGGVSENLSKQLGRRREGFVVSEDSPDLLERSHHPRVGGRVPDRGTDRADLLQVRPRILVYPRLSEIYIELGAEIAEHRAMLRSPVATRHGRRSKHRSTSSG